jgi:hypothetical protein
LLLLSPAGKEDPVQQWEAVEAFNSYQCGKSQVANFGAHCASVRFCCAGVSGGNSDMHCIIIVNSQGIIQVGIFGNLNMCSDLAKQI